MNLVAANLTRPTPVVVAGYARQRVALMNAAHARSIRVGDG